MPSASFSRRSRWPRCSTPAEVSLGYVEIARKDPKAGLPHFDRVLLRHPNDVDAQVGRGQAFLALGHNTEARAAFEAAVALDPSLTDIARRVDVLKFLSQQEDLRRAREAARAGRSDKAIREYTRAIASSPDTPFLYRELADVEWQKGDADAALEHFRKAAALDPFDARALSRIGEILESRADFDGAIKAYSDALAIDPNATMEARIEAVRARVHLARLPDEYRTIATLPKITRGDLAALIGVRLSPLLQGSGRDAVVVTDAHNHWAARWIIEVTRAGMVEAFANHTFQPGAVVRRIDLAQAVSRLLARIPRVPNQPRSWQSARLKFPDLSAAAFGIPCGVTGRCVRRHGGGRWHLSAVKARERRRGD